MAIRGDRRRRGRRLLAAALATALTATSAALLSGATAGTAAAQPLPVNIDPFYGAPDPSGCRTEDVVTMLGSPDALATQTEIGLNAAFGALGWPIGPREH